ncbi:mannose-1-phosphate guanylyltransferase (GDP) [Ekhidna lutea]|uniref:mannose-1-phosphate guanylyltransferase n=1 Tax=Ekhidna lutea TaxID=447679 RepID=A0A239FLY7_EKHLU|nr:mannose-1-phosphate guanylyltransferase [Ekhidna lutea]SNS57608.1 mannose-1-phosphate guanylyltransferase (GDP) [Ekhidna lutea]
MSTNIYVVIMAGGSGTRFWPYSRDAKPKQFLDVLGTGRSLLQMTFDRFKEVTSNDKIWVVSNQKYENLIQDQLPELENHQILLETEKRNTAPCIAYAAYKIMKNDPNAVIIVSPSDHAIFKEKEFMEVINTATESASIEDKLITIGIRPNRPETGYGYIQYLSDPGVPVKKVKTFTEKPEVDLAAKFIESGDFLWNSGIFVWSIDAIINAFEKYEEEIASLFADGLSEYYTENESAFIKKAYSQCKNISIDYAIMEKAENVYVVPGDFGWSDLGSWNALHEIKKKDSNDNVIEGSVITYDSKDNYIKGKKNKVTVVQGVEGLLVADFDDVLLVCKKADSSLFRDFITDVKAEKGEKYI